MSSEQPASQVAAGANRLGYSPSGIMPGSEAASHMESAAKSHGGHVPPGDLVLQLQSDGRKGNYHSSWDNKTAGQAASQVRAGAHRLGYTPSGVKSGTAAAAHMSAIAKAHGGHVPAGSLVSKLQAAGSQESSHSGSKGSSHSGSKGSSHPGSKGSSHSGSKGSSHSSSKGSSHSGSKGSSHSGSKGSSHSGGKGSSHSSSKGGSHSGSRGGSKK